MIGMKTQGCIMRKALSDLAEASLQLGEFLIDFGDYHGLPLQEFREWEWSLRVRIIKCHSKLFGYSFFITINTGRCEKHLWVIICRKYVLFFPALIYQQSRI